jgi:hypothetical protein
MSPFRSYTAWSQSTKKRRIEGPFESARFAIDKDHGAIFGMSRNQTPFQITLTQLMTMAASKIFLSHTTPITNIS